MAVVIPTGYAQVTLNFQNSLSDKVWSCVLGCQHTSSTPPDIASTFATAWGAFLAETTDTNISLVSETVRMGPSTGPSPGVSVEIPDGQVGTEAMTGAPANCTTLVSKLTAIGGRANRGRNYWPGQLSASTVNEVGQISSTHRDYLQVQFIDFFGALGSGNSGVTDLCPVVILHDETSPATTPQPVVAVQVQNVIGSQRRRIRS